MGCVGCSVIENKVSLPKLMPKTHKIWYAPIQIQTCLEKYGCNSFACELRYHAYNHPLSKECYGNSIIVNLSIALVSTSMDLRSRRGEHA